MSVVKGDRGLSDKEFWKLSLKIEAEITVVLLHDFGIKPKLYTIENYAEALHMTTDDAVKFHAICERYGVTQIKLDFPEWYVDDLRQWTFECLKRMRQNLRDAWEVYPYYESQFYARRGYQDDARRACAELLDIFSVLKRLGIVKAEKYVSYLNDVTQEIELIRSWSKQDNKILRRIREREAGTGTTK
jgi:hypothetical protein